MNLLVLECHHLAYSFGFRNSCCSSIDGEIRIFRVDMNAIALAEKNS